jgi:hypothetical protein
VGFFPLQPISSKISRCAAWRIFSPWSNVSFRKTYLSRVSCSLGNCYFIAIGIVPDQDATRSENYVLRCGHNCMLFTGTRCRCRTDYPWYSVPLPLKFSSWRTSAVQPGFFASRARGLQRKNEGVPSCVGQKFYARDFPQEAAVVRVIRNTVSAESVHARLHLGKEGPWSWLSLIASDSIRCRSSRSDRNRWLTNATQTDLRLHFSMELIDVFVGFVS